MDINKEHIRGPPHTFNLRRKSMAEISSCGRFNTRPIRKENSSGRNQQSDCSFYSHWTAYCHGISLFHVSSHSTRLLSECYHPSHFIFLNKITLPKWISYIAFLRLSLLILHFWKTFKSHNWFAVFWASWKLKGTGMKGFKLVDST